jgi:hypothetical protein
VTTVTLSASVSLSINGTYVDGCDEGGRLKLSSAWPQGRKHTEALVTAVMKMEEAFLCALETTLPSYSARSKENEF